MSDPAEEFRKLAEVVERLAVAVGETRGDLATALDRAAPDYRRDLAHIFTALKEIEQKPALGASAGALERSAAEGATKGASDAASALRAALGGLSEARQREAEHVHLIDRLSWQVWAGAFVVVLLCGLAGGVAMGVRLFPTGLMATEAGCGLAGGRYSPPAPPKQMAEACVFWGKPIP